MSPDEEKMLELLLKKQDEERAAAGAPVFRLFPGGKSQDTGALLQLKEFVRRVEAGELTQFDVIGLTPNGETLDARYSHTKPTFAMLGATLSFLFMRTRSIFG